jgi:hypothetical protein
MLPVSDSNQKTSASPIVAAGTDAVNMRGQIITVHDGHSLPEAEEATPHREATAGWALAAVAGWMIVLAIAGTSKALVLPADPILAPRSYLPLVARQPTPTYACPTTSLNRYEGGAASQFDWDNPVRPAHDHADKNIELRGYVFDEDPGLVHGFVDYDSDDPTQPPQFATLFSPSKVPSFANLYNVHNWDWAASPDPGSRGSPIESPPVTALGLSASPGEVLRVPSSGYSIGPGKEVLVLFADEDTVALRYTREDSSGSQGYTVHVDGMCTDPNLLALYDLLDNPDGPRYVFKPANQRPYWYDLPCLGAGQPIGTGRNDEVVVAISDTGTFQDPRSKDEWWQIRP